MPRDPNAKQTNYKQTRTRLNSENKAKVRSEIKNILANSKTKPHPDIIIRGVQGRVYHCQDTDRVVAIHTEGKFAGQVMKAQPISPEQLNLLRDLKILD